VGSVSVRYRKNRFFLQGFILFLKFLLDKLYSLYRREKKKKLRRSLQVLSQAAHLLATISPLFYSLSPSPFLTPRPVLSSTV
jgi:hypothetical protein